jgi:hypothetical protein
MRDNPNLSPEWIDRIRFVAQLRSVQAGEVFYEPSQPDVPLFIALEGSVWISDTGEDDRTISLTRPEKHTSSPARCRSFPVSARSSRRVSLAMAAAGRDDHY